MKNRLIQPVRYFREKTAESRAASDFLIIGAQKSGTTSLYYDLNSHPRLKANLGPKEVCFFTSFYEKGINYYSSFFPFRKKDLQYFQSCPYYLIHPLAPERVRFHFPDMKLIAILRNPVHRTLSHFNHQKIAGREPLSLDEALAAEEERLSGEEERLRTDPTYKSPAHRRYSYLRRGLYIQQINNWLAHFPESQLLILSSEEYFNNPGHTLSRVYDFLGVDSHYPNWIRKKEDLHKKVGFPGSQSLKELGGLFDRHTLSKIGLTRKINARPYKERATQEQKEYLFNYFYNPNLELFDHIGRDLGWNERQNL